MRGTMMRQVTFLTLTPDQLIPPDHPIRRVKPLVDTALAQLSPVFDDMYAEAGRPSIPPEHLLKACLLMAFYSIRSERQFCERLHYDLLFKWFLDLNVRWRGMRASACSRVADRGTCSVVVCCLSPASHGAPPSMSTRSRTSAARN